jgi:hypothetical protein
LLGCSMWEYDYWMVSTTSSHTLKWGFALSLRGDFRLELLKNVGTVKTVELLEKD